MGSGPTLAEDLGRAKRKKTCKNTWTHPLGGQEGPLRLPLWNKGSTTLYGLMCGP